ncbi:S8 family anti-phage peptidase IteS [Ralstonia pseudosolanacearum]
MATRQAQQNGQRRPANVDNPISHIPFFAGDLVASGATGGGGTIFVPVDRPYREALVATLNVAVAELADDLNRFPHSLGTLVFKLRENAIAKSHRPLKLAEEAQVQPAGHARIDEMLVGAQAASIELLRWVILNRDIKDIRANLSAIVRIESWTRARRNPEGTLALRERGTALLRPFGYFNEEATAANVMGLEALLRQLDVQYQAVSQGRLAPLFRLTDLDRVSDENLDTLLSFPGIRNVHAEPQYAAGIIAPAGAVPQAQTALLQPPAAADIPVVGVFDTGVAPTANALAPWVDGTQVFVLPPETDFVHGTMVASLVAGSYPLNADHAWLPQTGCKVHNVCALESAGGHVSDLIVRLRTAVAARTDIKVWNLSLGAGIADTDQFSEFAQVLDELSDQFGVLFVVASGNYVGLPRRGWPDATPLQDRVSTPGESVRALTVGSIAHVSAADTWVGEGAPAPYSRRGPGPMFTPKPDVVHVGGGVHAPWAPGSSSVNVLGPDNHVSRTFGTSFAAPIAASMAAHTWHALTGRQGLAPHPALVKALMIHAAQLSSPAYEALDRRYYGVGRPDDVVATLYDSDDSFTLAFQALVHPGMRWRKAPYPIPQSLMHNGKLRGEVIITATYSPPLNPNGGSEYVRANVEVSFGVLDGQKIKGKVPMESEAGQSGYESLQIEHGGKWAPVKVHRKVFPDGVAGTEWALQAGVFLRAFEPALTEAMMVTILVTVRALDGNPAVHADGVRALVATNWVREALPVRVPVRV